MGNNSLPRKKKMFFSRDIYKKEGEEIVKYYYWIHSIKPPFYPSYGYSEKRKIHESKLLAILSYALIFLSINISFIPFGVILEILGFSGSNILLIWIIYFVCSYVITLLIQILLLYVPGFLKIIKLMSRIV